MSWDTVQQLIRIAAYAGGSVVFGQAVADGELFQQALGGVIAVGAFVWWAVAERNKKA